ncbi:MAG: hypothetical protein KDI11_04345 [Alphaproteobacteria bacterium]|nr:hypothetical protein [Alphaproteobacteria bacterium]
MLIVPFRNNDEKTIEIRYVVPDGRPGAAALVPLTTISEKRLTILAKTTLWNLLLKER